MNVNSKQVLAWAVAVEARLLFASIVARGNLPAPRTRPGETAEQALASAAEAFKRWLLIELEAGRKFPELPPPAKRGWNGHWSSEPRERVETRKRRRGKVDGAPP
jgi:hypothetical protein